MLTAECCVCGVRVHDILCKAVLSNCSSVNPLGQLHEDHLTLGDTEDYFASYITSFCKAQIPLGSSRLDMTRHVRRVKQVETSMTNKLYCMPVQV